MQAFLRWHICVFETEHDSDLFLNYINSNHPNNLKSVPNQILFHE